MKQKVVQLVAFKSIYNENLQKNLSNNNEFANRFDLIELDIEEAISEFEKSNVFKKFKDISFVKKIKYIYYLNNYLILKYGYLKGSILHIQYVSAKYVFIFWFFKKVFSKIIITYWGSDLLRIKDYLIIPHRIISYFSSIITFETKSFARVFNNKICNKYSEKIRIVDFGIQILNDIDNVTTYDVESFKQKYGINLKKTVVAIGYSRIIEHQHIGVIQSLVRSNVNKDDIFIVFPWTYGDEANGYRNQIEDLIKGKYDYIFIDNQLTNKEIATLRCVTNILVHVETTDVMSFSMLETLYAKNNVITGSWLQYDDIYNEGITMNCVDSVDEVGNMITYLLNNHIDIKIVNQNKEIIERLYKWDNCISKWVDLYR